MKNFKNIKNIIKGAVDKIKASVEKPDIPLADAYAQMDLELEEAEKAFGKPLFPTDDEQISFDEYYLKILGFKEMPEFERIEAHYEALIKKYNPENFADDEEKQMKAAKRTDLINKAYQYFKDQQQEQEQKEEN